MVPKEGQIFFSNDEYEIRPAKNVDEFREMWWGFMQELGWNRGYYDIDSYVNPSKGSGMILLIDKASGKPCGHVGAVINPNETGWVSLFVIDEKHRGKGMGAELFKAAMKDFEQNGTQIIGLDGVVQQKATYERRKFVSSPIGTIRIMIRPLVAKESAAKATPPSGSRVVDIRQVPQDLLRHYELKYTGFDRPAQWSDEHIFSRKDLGGVAVVASSGDVKSIEQLKAWGLTRRCSGGIRIGPIYAGDAESAKAVLATLMKSATPDSIQSVSLPGEMTDWSMEKITSDATLVAEVYGGNPDAVKLFEDLGWKYAGVEYFRMWVDGKATKEQSPGGIASQGVYAIFDAAVG